MSNQYIISDLIIYPIKSLGGIHVSEALAEPTGLQYDRRWMLADADNRFISQREAPQLCLLKLSFHENGFFIQHHLYPKQQLFLPFEAQTSQRETVQVWDHQLQAVVAGENFNQWFSDMLGLNCKLIKAVDFTHRKVNPEYASNNEQTVFADGYPVLIIGEASLNDLNTKLTEPVPMDRFRPNLVFSGGLPFDEDNWSEIALSDVALKPVKPCERCVITTINQATAEAGKEPLKTLATYRNINNKILFGQNALVIKPGKIKTGETLLIKQKTY